jgi:acyl transferase domain-containing protein
MMINPEEECSLMSFEPIAVIGQSCVLPGALNPQQLVDLVLKGKDVLSVVPEGYWRTDPRLVLTDSPKNAEDQTWSDKGGYVKDFHSVFNPEGFAIPADEILQYDPLVLWVLHTAREALTDAGCLGDTALRTGIIFGNLSYPSHGVTKYSESVWLDAQG